MSRRPNVVFVLTDDQGYPPVGAHGHPFIQTPAMDAFQGESAHFEQFHVGTTCAPTRAGLLTGHHCNSTGVWHTIGGRSLLRADEWSLADALREDGYRTGLFGKWHLGDEHPYRPQDRGFETVVCHGGGGVSQQPDWWGNDYFDDTYRTEEDVREFDGYCTDVWFDEALKFIEENRDEPFFCYISTNAPHGPFNVEPDYRDLYSEETESEKYARFLGMITNIDENFARLRERLAELELEEDTILVFMSDNGQTGVGDPAAEMYNAGMRGMKGSPYEGGHRVPLMIRWPGGGIDGEREISHLTSYVDFMPTILDLCGMEVPEERSFHGESLQPLLRGESGGRWTERIMCTDTQRLAHPIKWRLSCVMKNCWRLVNGKELYDIETDPAQKNDVADAHPDLVEELREAYEEWWEICAEQMEEEIPISIGAEEQEVAVLRTHDMRNETDHSVVWNQGQVRQGETCHGWWEINVEREGLYEFELRRWPREAGHAITDGIEGEDVEFYHEGIAPGAEGLYSGGEALPYETACLTVTGLPQQCAPVEEDAAGAVFRVRLDSGPHHVRARFAVNDGHYSSAYYVYVRRVE